MAKYYTRACNFYYGKISKDKIFKKNALPLNGDRSVSFDHIEIVSRNFIKKVHFKKIKLLNKTVRKKIIKDLSNITKKKKFKKLNMSRIPILMGVLNLTPDSFSDGGKYNSKNLSYKHFKKLVKEGCKIIDVGGESTRPGSFEINEKKEWSRIEYIINKIKKLNHFVSLDTRKSIIMDKGIKKGVNLINDVSGLNNDTNTIKILKKTKSPFVLHHIQGTPRTMQNNPHYKNVLLDIYDFFEEKIKIIRKNGIKHNNIILDPGIGFGKNLKHNITLIKYISIFHSLGFPVMLGISRKKFIKDISGVNDTKKRTGGTISSSLYAMMQGVQILRVHDANEINQSIKVFKLLKFT